MEGLFYRIGPYAPVLRPVAIAVIIRMLEQDWIRSKAQMSGPVSSPHNP